MPGRIRPGICRTEFVARQAWRDWIDWMAIERERAQRLADEDLMPLIGEKDPEAFEVFYDRHGGAAYSLAYRIVGDRARAEDVTQEAFLSIWRSGARYDRARGSVRGWTLGITRNRAIDVLRRESGRAPKLDFDDEGILEQRPSGELTDEEAMRREQASEVRGALRELPSEQSKVIELAYFGGFSHSEIAEMLGMPLGTVKGRMRLGMEKIRGQLAEGFG
jgi:RNA polymerase sigma-70 factor, ECF subfamily